MCHLGRRRPILLTHRPGDVGSVLILLHQLRGLDAAPRHHLLALSTHCRLRRCNVLVLNMLTNLAAIKAGQCKAKPVIVMLSWLQTISFLAPACREPDARQSAGSQMLSQAVLLKGAGLIANISSMNKLLATESYAGMHDLPTWPFPSS